MNIGFCGLGLMGLPMVQRLIAAGHEVRVWNRTPEKAKLLAGSGILIAQTPQELAEQCSVVCLCLFDAQAVESVVFGPQGLAQGGGLKYIVDHSSIAPTKTIEFAARIHALNGATWIDAPVSGGVGGAQSGTLAIMAGGPRDAVNEVTPLMMAYGQRVTHMGGTGSGQVSKLCNQTIVTATIAAIGEAIALAQAAGVDAAQLSKALAGGWADSVLLQVFVPRMTSAPPAQKTATVNTMLKDLDTVGSLAQAHYVPMPVSAAAQQAYRLAAASGLGEDDVSQLIRLYQGNTGAKAS